jgi:hypothetical protein
MSYGPTAKCHFCGGLYYRWKLTVHERICSSRPERLTVGRAVRIAIGSRPEAETNTALLVRLVWEIKDGYHTDLSRGRLTEPVSIVNALERFRKSGNGSVPAFPSAR